MKTTRYPAGLLFPFVLVACLFPTVRAVDDAVLWPSDALTKVMRSDGPGVDSAQSLQICGARREIISGQVVFRPSRDIRAASVAITDLRLQIADG